MYRQSRERGEMNHDKFDLERELRASRPQPRGEYAKALADEVRGPAPERTRTGRVGLALALSGLIIVAVASFGGIGYASSAKKQATPQHVWIIEKPNTAAAAQYGCPPENCPPPTTTTENTPTTPSTSELSPFTPPTKPFTPPTKKTKGTVKTGPKGTTGTTGTGSTGTGQTGGTKATASQLPFTGLALWVPLAVGLMLISLGLVLRTRGRRRHTGAH
jgi:hypothetical protein